MSSGFFLTHIRTLDTTGSQLGIALACVGCWVTCRLGGIPVFPFGVLMPLLTIASVTDLMYRRIPNWLTYAAMALALSAAAVVSFRASASDSDVPRVVDFEESLAGFAAAFGVMLALYFTLGTGAGDVKLAGAIGACVGVQTGLHALLWTHLMAGLAMGLFVVWKVGPRWIARAALSRLLPDLVLMPVADHSRTFRYPVPMAVYFSIGTIIALQEVPLP